MFGISIHIGAGIHKRRNDAVKCELLECVCQIACEKLREGQVALDVALDSVKLLENSHTTNAGVGSCLNKLGHVECDASVMDSSGGEFGAVGAISNCKNPIGIAGEIMMRRKLPSKDSILEEPMLLVGHGADEFVEKNCPDELCDNEALITATSRSTYERNLNVIISNNSDYIIGDTVGCIVCDLDGDIVSAVSSGGIALKSPGRIGPACMFGCGCFAERMNRRSFGIATTGRGEHIIRTLAASRLARHIKQRENVEDALADCTLEFNDDEKKPEEMLIGMLALIHDEDDDSIQFGYTHSTPSMAIGYCGGAMERAKTLISRLDDDKRTGKTFLISSDVIWK